MTEFLAEKRETPTLPESVGLLKANVTIMQRNMESCRDEVMARLDAHSEVIEKINTEFELVNTTLSALARNIATESRLRREAAERSVEMHESLMSALQQVIATQGQAQMAFQDVTVRQATLERQQIADIRESKNALEEHAKRDPVLVRIIGYLSATIAVLLVWFHPWLAWLKALLPIGK